jgi:hypothetical protein
VLAEGKACNCGCHVENATGEVQRATPHAKKMAIEKGR